MLSRLRRREVYVIDSDRSWEPEPTRPAIDGDLAVEAERHVDNKGVHPDLGTVHGVSPTGIAYTITRRWRDRLSEPFFDGLFGVLSKAATSYFRFIDDGKLAHLEFDIDIMQMVLMETASKKGVLSVVAMTFVDQVTKGIDTTEFSRDVTRLGNMREGPIAFAVIRSGCVHELSASAVEHSAYRIAYRVSVDSKAWASLMETPSRFINRMIAEASDSKRDMKSERQPQGREFGEAGAQS